MVFLKIKNIKNCTRQLGLEGKIPGMVKSSWQKEIMSLSDPIGDMLARLKNSQMRNHKKLKCRLRNLKQKLQKF